MAPKLTDPAQRAVWARMAECPFSKGDLERAALAAGQSAVRSYSAITAFMSDLKAKGAIYSAPCSGSHRVEEKPRFGGPRA